MKFKIVGYEPKEEAKGPYSIRWWYDKYTRMWVVQVFNAEGNEVESQYCIKDEIASYVDYYKNEYQTEDARKYNRGE